LIATFRRQIAARDHDANPLTAHGGQQERRQVFEGFSCLDLQDDSRVLTSELAEPSLQIVDVRFRAREGIANEIGLSSYELQRLDN
jgi:hypothetical protein